jgi:hypothetical protein
MNDGSARSAVSLHRVPVARTAQGVVLDLFDENGQGTFTRLPATG